MSRFSAVAAPQGAPSLPLHAGCKDDELDREQ